MRALSVRCPWAPLIAAGLKSIELRSRPTSYRGPVLIVSSLRFADDPGDWSDIDGPRGVALCVVDIVDCRPATAADADDACVAPGPDSWAWVLANPRPVPNVPVRGQLGLFSVADGLLNSAPCAPSRQLRLPTI